MRVSLILACAGKGVRAGFNKNKLLVEFDGKPCFLKTFEVFYNSGLIDQFILTASENDFELVESAVGKKAVVVKGGATRTESVKNALEIADGDIVLIHDGARPFVTEKIIRDCIETAKIHGSAIPAVPTRNTVMRRCGNKIDCYLGKNGLYSVQTPQGFNKKLIKDAFSRAGEKVYNDDGEVYKEFIGEVFSFDGDAKNVKLTFPEDFNFTDHTPDYRFGTGFDCHRLVENRKLILGGVEIPHDKGLLGHSDADVLTHAIMDAILSALSMRDIGYHFSDKDPAYKDADSMKLLEKVLKMISEKGYRVRNVSATVMAEKPKLLPHIPSITQNLAAALNLSTDSVGIGATTLEGLGFVGREEGICVHATATLIK
ncbi:MAG: 2-C-methyl-D-erythritol 2,4-cyclodiphosphate synthase [Clostridia bacterium]|nr:2-C-methyl-D-erythritol 2,4-cyclodiphosphate synthase [Clostridia bacterium]